jgi:hypothetical protein
MSTVKNTKWPGISVTQSDRALIKRIQEYNGVLKGIVAKDLLLISASLALKHGLPKSDINEPYNADIVNPALMAKPEYADYKQYIAMIFYFTGANKDLANMADRSLMIKNFVDYAQRGLRLLENTYIGEGRAADSITDDLLERINSMPSAN